MTSAIHSFGVRLVGKEFTWWTHDVEGDPVEHKFRARAAIGFEETLEFKAIQARMQLVGQRSIAQLTKLGKQIDDDDSGAEEATWEKLQEMADHSVEQERLRWHDLIEQTLLLIHPPHVETFRPLLESGDPRAVRELRVWLMAEVMGEAQTEVEAVANVDPTLPPPPSDSQNSPNGGADSDSKESSSTGSPSETPPS